MSFGQCIFDPDSIGLTILWFRLDEPTPSARKFDVFWPLPFELWHLRQKVIVHHFSQFFNSYSSVHMKYVRQARCTEIDRSVIHCEMKTYMCTVYSYRMTFSWLNFLHDFNSLSGDHYRFICLSKWNFPIRTYMHLFLIMRTSFVKEETSILYTHF